MSNKVLLIRLYLLLGFWRKNMGGMDVFLSFIAELNIFMFNTLLKRLVYCKWYSLRNPGYLQLQEINILRKKLYSNEVYRQKFQYLQHLDEEHRLHNFYDKKQLSTLGDDELFFLMNSSTPYNLSRKGQAQAIAKVKSVYFKCLLYKQFGWLNEVEQYLILLGFNDQIIEMELSQIIFCLSVIQDFKMASSILKYKQLEIALSKYTQESKYTFQMILVHGYLLEIEIRLRKMFNYQSLQFWVVNNDRWDFKSIYFVYRLSQDLELEIKTDLKAYLDQLMEQTLKSFKFDKFQGNYLVFLLKYYPKHVQKLNIQFFTPKFYIRYLQYFKSHPELKLQPHKIPSPVLELTTNNQFKSILNLRLELKIDCMVSIAKSLSEYFVLTLNPVNIYLNLLGQQEQISVEIQYHLQNIVKSKFSLDKFDFQKVESFQIYHVIKLLTKMERLKLGSVDFWTVTVQWVQHLLAYSQIYKVIQEESGIYLELLSLAVSKNFKEETREIMYQKFEQLLGNDHYWPLEQLSKLISILSRHKIGEQKLWFLTEQQILKCLDKSKEGKHGHNFEDILSRIALRFNSMGQGSFKFWSQMNEILSPQTKEDILSKVRMPNSQVHVYLKNQ